MSVHGVPRAAALAVLLLAAGGCGWMDDHFDCGNQTVELLNSDQSIAPVAILFEEESLPEREALLVSGASRRLDVCVERGDAKRFRAVRGGETLAVANCVVSRARYEYEATVLRVVWDARGLVCENW